LAKKVFQAHGAGADGSVDFHRKLSRAHLLKFMVAQSPCVVAMELYVARSRPVPPLLWPTIAPPLAQLNHQRDLRWAEKFVYRPGKVSSAMVRD